MNGVNILSVLIICSPVETSCITTVPSERPVFVLQGSHYPHFLLIKLRHRQFGTNGGKTFYHLDGAIDQRGEFRLFFLIKTA